MNADKKIDNTASPANIVYQSPQLIILQISPDVYRHVSYLNTETFGKVPCNGMIVANDHESVVFDTPADDESSKELISWLKDSMQFKIIAVVPTHFHEDCLGGLEVFKNHRIPSYAYFKTIAFAKEKGLKIPQYEFRDSISFLVGSISVIAKFIGEGHTRDNVVAYVPRHQVLFGGCLIKELNASKGNLEDANVAEWPMTIRKLKNEFPDVKIVIPGHGEPGNSSLLNYTEQLFEHSDSDDALKE